VKKLPLLDRFEICLAGTGGQGVLTLGRILGQSLALEHGYFVTQTQTYGAEARGGSSRSDLVISSRPISHPGTDRIDLLAALSQEAANRLLPLLKPGGVLLVNTSLVAHVPTSRFLGLPFTGLARDRLGLPQAMNTIVLGAVTHLLPFARKALVERTLEQSLPPKILPLNLKAFELGLREAKKAFHPSPWDTGAEAAEPEGEETS
jgi:2-oxoglutarate ferredoxin oxidoreductase subunit gamma